MIKTLCSMKEKAIPVLHSYWVAGGFPGPGAGGAGAGGSVGGSGAVMVKVARPKFL